MKAWLYIFAFLFGLSFWAMPTHDPDLGWHLLGGAWTLEHGDVPRQDIINSFAVEWIDYHWLAQIIFFKIYSFAGFVGLRIFLGLIMALLCMGIMQIVITETSKKVSSIVPLLSFLILATFVGEVTSVRPHVIGLLIILLGFSILRKSRFKKDFDFKFLLFFVLTAILSNIHVYWVLMPFLWFVFQCLPRFYKSNSSTALYAWGGLILVSFAGFLSPYGIFSSTGSYLANYVVIYDYLVMPKKLREFINEFKPGLSAETFVPLLILFCTALSFRFENFKKLSAKAGDSILAITALILSIRALKFISLYGIFAAPIVSRNMSTLFRKSLPITDLYLKRFSLPLFAASFIYISFHVYTSAPWVLDNSSYMDEYLPIKACAKIPTLDLSLKTGRDHIRVMTHFNYGGWCRWIAYETDPNFNMKVTTDGRTQLVPVKDYEASFDLYRLKNNWAQTLIKWSPDVVLVEKSSALAQILIRAPQEWKLVHEDPFFALFLPNQ